MNPLRTHYRDICLVLALLCAGCETTQPQKKKKHLWQVYCDPNPNTVVWQSTGQHVGTGTNIVIYAPRGRVVKCWTTDGQNNSTTNQITLQ